MMTWVITSPKIHLYPPRSSNPVMDCLALCLGFIRKSKGVCSILALSPPVSPTLIMKRRTKTRTTVRSALIL